MSEDLFKRILTFVKAEELKKESADKDLEDTKEELEDKRSNQEKLEDFTKSVSYDYDAEEEPYTSFGVSGLLSSSQKLLNVNKGIDETDNRDELMFKKMFPVNKQISERIRNDGTGARKKLLAAASYRKNLSFLTPFYFDSYGEKQLVGNPLSSPLEEINPIHLLENARRVTQLGEGGIQSSDSITESMQSVSPGQFGFLSGLEGPECFPDYVEVMTDEGWKTWDNVTESDLICCLGPNYHRYFAKPFKLFKEDFKGNLIRFWTDRGDCLTMTRNHRVYTVNEHSKYFANDVRIHLASELLTEPFFTLVEVDTTNGFGLTFTRIEKAEEVSYSGSVYCASTMGGSVLVRENGGTSWWTGNSERIGVDARLTKGVKIGSDGRLYQLFLNKRTGNYEYMNPEQVATKIVKLPD
jgi:hypothetical protein